MLIAHFILATIRFVIAVFVVLAILVGWLLVVMVKVGVFLALAWLALAVHIAHAIRNRRKKQVTGVPSGA